MGEQLFAQYQHSNAGEQANKLDWLFFGAMVSRVRSHIVLSARRQNSATRGPTAKGNGLSTWLAKYAPKIPRATCYDWMAIAEGVQAHFRLAADVDMKALMCSNSEDLAPKLAKTADRIRKYLEGKTRKQLELQFSNRTTGGRQEPSSASGEPTEIDPAEMAVGIWTPLLRQLAEEGFKEKSWMHLPAKELAELKGLLVDLNKAITHDAKAAQ